MAGFCANPNVAGVLLVGLGCEEITPEVLAAELETRGRKRVEILSIQREGGTTPAITVGCDLARRLIRAAETDRRVSIDVSELVVGVKCGGSDALSGLTANPAVGAASDSLVSGGATVIMTEVPEMIGAEHLLGRRAADDTVRRRVREVVADMEAAILATGVDVRGTEPSPGNIEGGLTTLEEKSLGAIVKGGTTPVRQVVLYGEKPSSRGLVIMDGPALDAVSVTGMLAAGAQVVVFTTGRGSPLGAAIAPVIKVASNSAVYRHMRDNMDLDAGEIVDPGISVREMGDRILGELLMVAGGRLTRSERLGHREFGIHSIGPAV
ncbi:MAG: UxaA family hydrolase, partial [Thermoleophilia bacterium]|nr:UxaA family hydrolase [Thermoleophilia bacterium]